MIANPVSLATFHIITTAKKALAANEKLDEGSVWSGWRGKIPTVKMRFLPDKARQYTAESIARWFGHCKKYGLQDLRLSPPIEHPAYDGYSGSQCLVCYWADGTVTFFGPKKDSDYGTLIYSEYEWPDAPAEKPHYPDNTEDFKASLEEITAFSIRLANEHGDPEGYFIENFDHASGLLNGTEDKLDETAPTESHDRFGIHSLPSLPAERQAMWQAACSAHVFGSWWSWNDTPYFLSGKTKELSAEFDRVTQELSTQINAAILYVMNEW